MQNNYICLLNSNKAANQIFIYQFYFAKIEIQRKFDFFKFYRKKKQQFYVK